MKARARVVDKGSGPYPRRLEVLDGLYVGIKFCPYNTADVRQVGEELTIEFEPDDQFARRENT